MKNLISNLDVDEQKWWEASIKEQRRQLIPPPQSHVEKILNKLKITPDILKNDIDNTIQLFRESVWQLYLEDEASFHREILKFLTFNRELPKIILTEITEKVFLDIDFSKLNKDKLVECVAHIAGDYVGRVMPYIYALNLSTTQSRRSRAGKVFEKIIECFLTVLGYKFSNQAELASDKYKTLGKKVDLVIPSCKSYEDNRSKCAIITMKTTLRERWQEVAEELHRTNVSHIYLLTVDDDISPNKINTMKQHNITLIVFKDLKNNKFSGNTNVESYDYFFFKEIPHILNYWE